MYLQIRKICYFFEKISDTDGYFFNVKDYQIYSAEEQQASIISDTYEVGDYLLIPQIDRNEIVKKYLSANNIQNLLHKQEDKDFDRIFHWYIEDNHLTDDWNYFEQSELSTFASKWCEQNQIRYTLKPLKDRYEYT